jgi:hypothetical protein
MLLVISVVVGWSLCAVLSTGYGLAYERGQWPSIFNYRDALAFNLLFGLWSGPVGLIIAFFTSDFGRYGWEILPQKDKRCPKD